MRKRITLNTFRKLDAAEERMLRAVMPKTSAADPEPLPRFAAPAVVATATNGARLVRPLTVTLAEAVAS